MGLEIAVLIHVKLAGEHLGVGFMANPRNMALVGKSHTCRFSDCAV